MTMNMLKGHFQFPRQESLVLPDIQNPFSHRLHLDAFDLMKIAVMSVTIAPIRLVMAGLMLVLAWPIAALSMWGHSPKEPMTGWRKMLRPLVSFLCRSVFFMGGFHWVSVKGKRASAEVAPILSVAPHSSFFDVVLITYLEMTTAVGKNETLALPIFGCLTKFTQPVLVSRDDPNSRANTIQEIKDRAQSNGKWPQILIFPEGTCTNRSCLITFKPGAFYPGVPVQPVTIRYPNHLDTYTWTWDGPGPLAVLWLSLCQIHNTFEVEFLPVYTPCQSEIDDAQLYGQNVRVVMAKELGIPMTDHTLDDCRLMMKAAKNKLPMTAGIVEFYKLHKKLGLTSSSMQLLFDKFCTICSGQTGTISIEQFAEYLHLPVTDTLKEVFCLYDRDGSGCIDFREYVIGMSLVSGPASTEDTVQLAFKLFDGGSKGYITLDELTQILHEAFQMNNFDCAQLFKEVDHDGKGRITYDDFENTVEQKPEYAQLFLTYQELGLLGLVQATLENGHPPGFCADGHEKVN